MGKHRRRTDRALIGLCDSSSATLARDTWALRDLACAELLGAS